MNQLSDHLGGVPGWPVGSHLEFSLRDEPDEMFCFKNWVFRSSVCIYNFVAWFWQENINCDWFSLMDRALEGGHVGFLCWVGLKLYFDHRNEFLDQENLCFDILHEVYSSFSILTRGWQGGWTPSWIFWSKKIFPAGPSDEIFSPHQELQNDTKIKVLAALWTDWWNFIGGAAPLLVEETSLGKEALRKTSAKPYVEPILNFKIKWAARPVYHCVTYSGETFGVSIVGEKSGVILVRER